MDSTDFLTPKTGLTIANTDIRLVVNGAASANKNSGGGTHRVNGVYGATFDATDTATVGEMEVSVVVAGALPVFDKFFVIEEAVYDALCAASAAGYQVPIWAAANSTVNLSGTTVKTATDVETDTADIQTRLPEALTGGGNIKADSLAISGDATAADNAESFFDGTGYAGTNNVIPTVTTLTGHTAQTGDAFARIGATGSGLTSLATQASVNTIDDFVDTEVAAIKAKTDLIPGTTDGKTFAELVTLIAAVLLGKASGLATTTAVYRAVDDSKARVSAVVDGDGNRSAVTLDAA